MHIEFRNLDFTVWRDTLQPYSAVAAAAVEWIRSTYPELRGVHFLPQAAAERPIADVLAEHGYGELVPLAWTDDGVRYQSTADERPGRRDGAFLAFLHEQGSDRSSSRPALFIYEPPHEPKPFDYAGRLGFVLHEAAHLDDVAQGINLRIGGAVDWAAAEEYAHRQAIRKLHADAHALATYAYIAGVRAAASRPDDSAYRRAAMRAIFSDEARAAVDWLNMHFNGLGDIATK